MYRLAIFQTCCWISLAWKLPCELRFLAMSTRFWTFSRCPSTTSSKPCRAFSSLLTEAKSSPQSIWRSLASTESSHSSTSSKERRNCKAWRIRNEAEKQGMIVLYCMLFTLYCLLTFKPYVGLPQTIATKLEHHSIFQHNNVVQIKVHDTVCQAQSGRNWVVCTEPWPQPHWTRLG